MTPTSRYPRTAVAAAGAVCAALLAVAVGACGRAERDSAALAAARPPYDIGADTGPVTVRLGYFPNLTHAPAIVGVEDGLFATALGPGRTLKTTTFNAGPEAVEALFAGALDIAYLGPNPAINAFAKSRADGGAIRIIAGSTSGGAALVTKPEITSAEDLAGTTLASPQLGGTQDVALRAWLKDQGLSTDTTGAGEVSVRPQANGDALTAFAAGEIDGAWVPEPWVSRLVLEGGGRVLVDEATLWPRGDFATTHIVVRTAFMGDHPDAVAAILRGHLAALDAIDADPAAAQATTNDGIERITGKALTAETIATAWKRLRFTVDPIASSLARSAEGAASIGLLDTVDLTGIYDLAIVNSLLIDRGESAVSDAGLANSGRSGS